MLLYKTAIYKTHFIWNCNHTRDKSTCTEKDLLWEKMSEWNEMQCNNMGVWKFFFRWNQLKYLHILSTDFKNPINLKIYVHFKFMYGMMFTVESFQFVGKQKILLVRGDVISWVSYAMSPGKITLTSFILKLRKKSSFLYIIMLQNRLIFLVNTSMRPVIAGKWTHLSGFRARWTKEIMIAI